MRDYAKVRTGFWVRGTGKALRGDADAQRVAFYLMTAPTGHMTGLFYLALPTLMHEVGISEEGALKGLRRLSEEGFAHYDAPSEVVFLPAGAREQIDEALKPTDNRVRGVRDWLAQFKKHRFYSDFLAIYAEPYHLQDLAAASPLQAPSKALRSQEQEQKQEQEHEHDQEQESAPAPLRVAAPPTTAAPGSYPRAIQLWCEASSGLMDFSKVRLNEKKHHEGALFVLKATGGDETEIARLAGNFWADPWNRDNRIGFPHFASNLSKWETPPKPKASKHAPAPKADDYTDEEWGVTNA